MKLVYLLLSMAFGSTVQALSLPIHQGHEHRYVLLQYKDFQLVAFRGAFSALRSQSPLAPLIHRLSVDKPVLLWVTESWGGYGEAFVQTMKQLKDGGKRHVRMISTGPCSSGCTAWSSMADEAFFVPGASSYRIHRTWAFSPSFTLKTPKQMARSYGEHGANEAWFMRHLFVFDKKNQTSGYVMTARQVLDSGLADGTIAVEDLKALIGADIYRAIRANL